MKLRQRRAGTSVLPLHNGAGQGDPQQRRHRRKKRTSRARFDPKGFVLVCCCPATSLLFLWMYLRADVPMVLSDQLRNHSPRLMKLFDSAHTNRTMFKNLPSQLVQQQRLEEEPYKCSDGTIGFRNDDYCDCADGSDEPNTSACSDRLVQVRSFPCNDGSHIYASRVLDGVKDCPDGSDEHE